MYDAVSGPAGDALAKTLASAFVDVAIGVIRGRLGGGTKGTAREYFVLWRWMTRSKCAISSSEEGQGSMGVHE